MGMRVGYARVSIQGRYYDVQLDKLADCTGNGIRGQLPSNFLSPPVPGPVGHRPATAESHLPRKKSPVTGLNCANCL